MERMSTMADRRVSRNTAPLDLWVYCVLGFLEAGWVPLQAVLSPGVPSVWMSPLTGAEPAVSATFALGQVVLVWGLFEVKHWAWNAAVFVVSGSVLVHLLRMIQGHRTAGALLLTALVLFFLLVRWRLFLSRVDHSQFRPPVRTLASNRQR